MTSFAKRAGREVLCCALFFSLSIFTHRASAQLPGAFDVPTHIWPTDIEWRSSPDLRRTATTRFGEITVSQSGGESEIGPRRTTEVRLNGVSISPEFTGNSSLVFIADVVPLGDLDIVVFEASQGGSGSPPPTLNLLPVGPAGMGNIASDPEFHSEDWTQRIAVTDSRIYFDLGFKKGLRIFATYGAEGLAVSRFETNATSLPNEDCWRLFSIVGSGTCLLNSGFSRGLDRWLLALDQHPAFERSTFLQVCEGAKADGAPPLFDEFENQVCRERPSVR